MKTPDQIAREFKDAFEVRDGDVQETSWSFIQGVIAEAIEADRAQREERAVTIDLNTGDWLSKTTLHAGQGAIVASSVLPGASPELVADWYGSWMSDDPAPATANDARRQS